MVLVFQRVIKHRSFYSGVRSLVDGLIIVSLFVCLFVCLFETDWVPCEQMI